MNYSTELPKEFKSWTEFYKSIGSDDLLTDLKTTVHGPTNIPVWYIKDQVITELLSKEGEKEKKATSYELPKEYSSWIDFYAESPFNYLTTEYGTLKNITYDLKWVMDQVINEYFVKEGRLPPPLIVKQARKESESQSETLTMEELDFLIMAVNKVTKFPNCQDLRTKLSVMYFQAKYK